MIVVATQGHDDEDEHARVPGIDVVQDRLQRTGRQYGERKPQEHSDCELPEAPAHDERDQLRAARTER